MHQGANAVDGHGWSALHYSSASGQLELCKYLLSQSSDVNSTLNDFSTPLMLAVEEAHLEVAELLLKNGAMPWCKARILSIHVSIRFILSLY